MQTVTHSATADLALPAILLAALLGVIGWETGAVRLPHPTSAAVPETVTITPHPYAYRDAGDYLQAGVAVDAPMVEVDRQAPIKIMTFQVTVAEYADCVADGACQKADARRPDRGDAPITGVSFRDAEAFATWMSRRTGEVWRLPTVAEWDFAAGSKAPNPTLAEGSASDPAQRWLAQYEQEAASKTAPAALPVRGDGNVNEFGVAGLSASVWEWTSTCGSRTALDSSGTVASRIDSCGVRYLEGRHRTALSIIIRDARGGGCATGIPPDNLGFRLVRERR